MTSEPNPRGGQDPAAGDRRSREALIAEALGDVGLLLNRLSALEARCRETAIAMEVQAAALDASARRYAQAVQSVDAAARERFTAHVAQQTRTTLQEILTTIDRARAEAVGAVGSSGRVAAALAASTTTPAAPKAPAAHRTRQAWRTLWLGWRWSLALGGLTVAATTAVLHWPVVRSTWLGG